MEMNVSCRPARAFQKAFATNAATSGFDSLIPTIVPPSGNGVWDFEDGGGLEVPEWVTVLPYGLGSDEDVFSLRLVGWRRIGGVGPIGSYLWVPSTQCELACTLGTCVGIAGSPVLNTERFCDTITIVTEPTITAATTRQGTVELFNPGDNTAGYFRVRLNGIQRLQFTADQTTQTPTMNALIAFF